MNKWFSGKVVKGEKIGTKLGFPTINISPPSLPPENKRGVYSAEVKFGGRKYPALLYFGPRLIRNQKNDVLEIHLLNFSGNLYGLQVDFRTVRYLRDVMNFASAEDFKIRLKRDMEAALQDFK